MLQPLRAFEKNRHHAWAEFANGVTMPGSLPTHMNACRENLCNLKCVYCYDHRPGSTHPRQTLPEASWNELVALIPQVGMWSFFGVSEFFVDREFFPLMETCSRAGVTMSLNTNATVCTPRHVQCLVDYGGRLDVLFSIDAATEATYRRIRGFDFWRMLANVRTYVDALQRRPPGTTRVEATFVMTRGSMHELPGFLALVKSLGIRNAKAYRLHGWDCFDWRTTAADGTTWDYRAELSETAPREYDEALAQARQMAALLGMSVHLPAPTAGV